MPNNSSIPMQNISPPNEYLNYNNNKNNAPIQFNNNNNPMNEYSPPDLQQNNDPRHQMNIYGNSNMNYASNSNMNMNINQIPDNYMISQNGINNLNNNMNYNGYDKDNYTPQTRERLRMAGNNIFK